jgi:hypothetical protein
VELQTSLSSCVEMSEKNLMLYDKVKGFCIISFYYKVKVEIYQSEQFDLNQWLKLIGDIFVSII